MGAFSAKCKSNTKLCGKTAFITGANCGIGKETARDLYRRGGRVILACRDLRKAEEASFEIRHCCRNQNAGEIVVTQLDLASFSSIRNCASKTALNEKHIDLLINNAGIMLSPYAKTKDNFEIHFGVNHLGHFMLTLLLFPIIRNSEAARIVNVSSLAYILGEIDFNDLNWEHKPYNSLKAYQQSKLANVLFSKELVSRLKRANVQNVNIFAVHPGIMIRTSLGRHLKETNAFSHLLWNSCLWLMKSPEQGAQTTIYCAVDEACSEQHKLFYANCGARELAKCARDDDLAKRLWEESVNMTKIRATL